MIVASGLSHLSHPEDRAEKLRKKAESAMQDPGVEVLYRSAGWPSIHHEDGEARMVIRSRRRIGDDAKGEFRFLRGGLGSDGYSGPRIVASFDNGNDAVVARWRGTSILHPDLATPPNLVELDAFSRPIADRPDFLAFAASDDGIVGFVALLWAKPDSIGELVENAAVVARQNKARTGWRVGRGILGPLGRAFG